MLARPLLVHRGPRCLLVCLLASLFCLLLVGSGFVNRELLVACRSSGLVYFVLDFMNIFRPARATAAAGVALLRRRAYVTSSGLRHDCGPMGPGVAGLCIIFRVA